jgi:hypothetical protein
MKVHKFVNYSLLDIIETNIIDYIDDFSSVISPVRIISRVSNDVCFGIEIRIYYKDGK